MIMNDYNETVSDGQYLLGIITFCWSYSNSLVRASNILTNELRNVGAPIVWAPITIGCFYFYPSTDFSQKNGRKNKREHFEAVID